MPSKTTVVYYRSTSGDNPISDFLDSLPGKQQSKLLRVFTHIDLYGLASVIPHLKKLSNLPLWEIRVLGKDNLRAFYALVINNQVLILHGFLKKTQKTPSKDISIALDRLKDWNQRYR